MRFSDHEHCPGIGLGAPLDDPSDFSRRRFAARLRTERPMLDQEDTALRKERVMLDILHGARGDFGSLLLGDCEVITYNAFPRLPSYLAVIPRFPKPLPKRWVSAANLNLRFLGRGL
jgi:hypothetical protein